MYGKEYAQTLAWNIQRNGNVTELLLLV